MKTLTLLLVVTWIVAASAAAQNAAPTPTPAPEAAERPLSLDLHRIAFGDDRSGHAEFNLDLRREVWNDPMVRLEYALYREEAAARGGGNRGVPTQFTAGTMRLALPDTDPRMILKGPWADDWTELTPGEKVGRAAETAVTYGIIFEILRSLHR